MIKELYICEECQARVPTVYMVKLESRLTQCCEKCWERLDKLQVKQYRKK